MAERNDLTVDYGLSPRIIRVPDTSTQLNVQDLHDTAVGRFEEELPNLDEPFLILSAGKQDLGGGVLVGITAELQDTVVSFDARKVSQSSGTVTTADAAGVTLTDSAADFVTDNVEPGAWVVNLTDGSIASVIRRIDANSLLTDGLGDGVDNEFGIGDSYKVFPVIQCELDGGNVVAVDAIGDPISPILPTAGTQVIRTSSSSATLQQQADIQFASYEGRAWVDELSAHTGTTHPKGTPREPVNNIPDAVAIIAAVGLRKAIQFIGDFTFGAGDILDGYELTGENPGMSAFTVGGVATMQNCEIRDAYVTGTLDGGTTLIDCQIEDLTYVDGAIDRCQLEGTITLSGAMGTELHIVEPWSGVIGTGAPIIDFNASGTALGMRGLRGGVKLANKSGSESVSIDLNGGQVRIASDVTNGTIVVRGPGKVVDDATGVEMESGTYNGSLVLINETLSGVRQALIKKLLQNRFETDPVTGKAYLYDDDDVTVLLEADIFEDAAGTTPYGAASEGIERRNRLVTP